VPLVYRSPLPPSPASPSALGALLPPPLPVPPHSNIVHTTISRPARLYSFLIAPVFSRQKSLAQLVATLEIIVRPRAIVRRNREMVAMTVPGATQSPQKQMQGSLIEMQPPPLAHFLSLSPCLRPLLNKQQAGPACGLEARNYRPALLKPRGRVQPMASQHVFFSPSTPL